MLHPVTIEDGARDDIISQLTNHNNAAAYGDFTSPKLVNRQLKVMISSIQESFYKDILRRLQSILRKSNGMTKERTKTSSFVLMIGLALCQEELEHNRYLRAEGDIKRNENTDWTNPDRTRETIMKEAQQDCKDADTGFDFLVTLFNCKYSPAKRYQACLIDWSKKVMEPTEKEFLQSVFDLGHKYRKSRQFHALQ